jgi:hypothetical protein
VRNTFAPTDEQKLAALGHIFYEMQAFAGLCRIDSGQITYAPNEQLGGVLRKTYAEAMLMHVLTLLDFFECSIRKRASYAFRSDNIISEDFGFPHRTPLIADALRDRINKEVVHLSYSRPPLADLDAPWDWPRIVQPIAARCLAFVEHVEVDSRRVSDPNLRWDSLKRDLRGLVAL